MEYYKAILDESNLNEAWEKAIAYFKVQNSTSDKLRVVLHKQGALITNDQFTVQFEYVFFCDRI